MSTVAEAIPAAGAPRADAVPRARDRRVALALAAIWLVLVASTGIWLAVDRSYLYYDPVEHITDAINVWRDPAHSSLRAPAAQWPPGFALLAGPLLMLSGYRVDLTIFLVSAIALAVLLWSVYRVGALLYDDATGLVAAGLTAAMPAIFGQSRTFMLDVPLAAAVMLTCAVLYDPLALRRRSGVVGLGLLLAVGLLLKSAYAFFVAGPLAGELYRAWRDSQAERVRRLVAAGAVGAAIALLWYGPRLPFFLGGYGAGVVAGMPWYLPGDHPLFSPMSLLYYVVAIWHLASLPVFLLWLAALPALWRGERRSRNRLLVAVAPAYLALTSVPVKASRYGLPLAPFAALMLAAGWRQYRDARWARWAAVAVSVFLAVQFYAASFGIPLLPAGSFVDDIVQGDERLSLWTQSFGLSPRAGPQDWGVDEWYRAVVRGAEPLPDQQVQVGVLGHQVLADLLTLQERLARARGERTRPLLEFQRVGDLDELSRYPVVVVQLDGPAGPYDAWQRKDGRAWLAQQSPVYRVVDTRGLKWHVLESAEFVTAVRAGR